MYEKFAVPLLLIVFGFSCVVLSTPVPNENHTFAATKTSMLGNHKAAQVADKADSKADASTEYEESSPFSDANENYRHASNHRGDSAEVEIDHSIEIEGKSQNFIPSFANLFQQRQPLGHSRPTNAGSQEGAYSQRPSSFRNFLNYQANSFNAFRNNDYGKSIASSSNEANSILGSGNFGVIRGGTFFADSSDTESEFSDDFESPYYNGNNGHGRPSFYFGQGNPRPNYNNQEQFANFRDFADINAPAGTSFSHYVVVYANKNGTVVDHDAKNNESHLANNPKNIIEKISQIEAEKQSALPTEEPEKKNKISKGKLKLSLIKEKKHKSIVKKMLNESDAKDMVDPLLALS